MLERGVCDCEVGTEPLCLTEMNDGQLLLATPFAQKLLSSGGGGGEGGRNKKHMSLHFAQLFVYVFAT
jgi:hypothetical protein